MDLYTYYYIKPKREVKNDNHCNQVLRSRLAIRVEGRGFKSQERQKLFVIFKAHLFVEQMKRFSIEMLETFVTFVEWIKNCRIKPQEMKP